MEMSGKPRIQKPSNTLARAVIPWCLASFRGLTGSHSYTSEVPKLADQDSAVVLSGFSYLGLDYGSGNPWGSRVSKDISAPFPV
jgi:hypothetical protein